MAPIRPFQIAIPDPALKQLQQKLELTVLPPAVDDENGKDGAPL